MKFDSYDLEYDTYLTNRKKQQQLALRYLNFIINVQIMNQVLKTKKFFRFLDFVKIVKILKKVKIYSPNRVITTNESRNYNFF